MRKLVSYGLKHLQKIMDKYNTDIAQLQIHSSRCLVQWKDSHLFGLYPTKEVTVPLPKTLWRKFKI